MNQVMSEKPFSEPRPAVRWGLFGKGLLLFLAGGVLGVGAVHLTGQWQEARKEQASRQRAEALCHRLVPRIEAQLTFCDHAITALQGQMAEASLASTSSSVRTKFLAARQRQIATQLELAAQGLRQLPDVAEANSSIVSPEQQGVIVGLQARFENAQQMVEALGNELEIARDQQMQLAVTEQASFRRPAEVLATRPAETEPSRASTEAILRVQVDAINRAHSEAARQVQTENIQRAYLDTLQRLQQPAPVAVYAPMPMNVCRPVWTSPVYWEPPLVIGRSYSQYRLGDRACWNGGRSGYPGRYSTCAFRW